jgi:formamidopyrimidine-DNA glycosylase
MIELPEARTLARQMAEAYTGRTIVSAVAGASPHGFAWYFGDPGQYGRHLAGRIITGAASHGGLPELWAEDWRICCSDGVNLRHLAPGAKRPAKHQLLVEFDDGSALVGTVAMYGGLWVFPEPLMDNPYYQVALAKPSPLTAAFDLAYFRALLDPVAARLSAKAFLATEQRIPGLGNGVLQDILWQAGIHPKRRMDTVDQAGLTRLFEAVKTLLVQMADQGGRDTEKDLFAQPGGYQTRLSRLTVGTGCPVCDCPIERVPYLGGTVYLCPGCQPIG